MSAQPSIPFLLELLRLAMRKEASALYIVPWMPPTLRIDGRTVPLSSTSFDPAQSTRLVLDVLDAAHRAALDRSREIEFDFALDGVGRFRVHAFRRHGQPAMTIRPFATELPTPLALALPLPACQAVLADHGLLVIASASASLRREVMAALLEHRNRRVDGTLLLLDGASRFWHEDARGRVRQAASVADVEARLMQRSLDPGPPAALAIAWGDLDDGQRLQQAVHAADTALGVVALDAENPLHALQRLAALAAECDDDGLRRRCALRLHALLALRPVPARSGGRDLAVTELLPNTPALAAELAEGDFAALRALLREEQHDLPQRQRQGAAAAYRSADAHLFELVQQERVAPAVALQCARDRAAFEQRLERHAACGSPHAAEAATRVDTAFADLFHTGAAPLDAFGFAEPTMIAPPAETLIDEVDWSAVVPAAPSLSPLAAPTPAPQSLQAQVWTAPAVAPGTTACIDVWIARAAQAEEVARRAAGGGSGNAAEAVIEEAMPTLTVELRVDDLLKAPLAQRTTWTGQVQRLRFEIPVPAQLPSGPRAGSVRLAVHGLVIGELGFMLALRAGAGHAAPAEDANAVRRMVHRAYAAFADVDRGLVDAVLQPLAQLAPDLDVFRGSATLRSGSGWRERIENELAQRERLYLFWSRAAAESPWVDFEWRRLLRSRGATSLDIVLLEPPRLAPLPRELADLPPSLWRPAGVAHG